MATKNGKCILCQEEKILNLEHVPPQGVGNKGGKHTITGNLEAFQSWDFSKNGLPRDIKRQPKGNAYFTLCIECNSKLGGEYVKHYVDFAIDNKAFLYRTKHTRNFNQSRLTHSIKGINPLRVSKEIVAMFFSINGSEDDKDDEFLDSVRDYIKEPKNSSFPKDRYKIIMNYYYPVSTHLIKEINIANDMVANDRTHNYIRPFVQHDLQGGGKIKYSEIQYEGIGLTLIDLKSSNFEINIGFDLEKFLTSSDKPKKIHLYNVPVITPTSTSMMEKVLDFPVEDVGADLLLRDQRIINYIKTLNAIERKNLRKKLDNLHSQAI